MKPGARATTPKSFGCAAYAGFSLLGCPQLLDDHFDTAARHGFTAGDAASGDGLLERDGADAQVVTRAFVARAVPDDGERGVLPDAALVLGFSTSMDTGSVEAAYTSSDIPAESVTFVWSETNTVLEVRPKVALRTVSGSDPSALAAIAYTFAISSAAKDAAGRALEPKRISFSVARLITQSSSAVTDRDLTGNWCSDDVYGTSDCELTDQTICFGDSSRKGEPSYKGFVTFDLRSLPPNLIDISAAKLSMTVALLYGSPFVELGVLRAEHVSFDAIGTPAYSAPALSSRTVSVASAVGDSVSADVTAEVRADWGMRDSSQFRLAFDIPTDSDVSADVVVCEAGSARLELHYWLP